MIARPLPLTLLALTVAALAAASPATADGLWRLWATKQADGMRSDPAPLFVDVDGDGRLDIATVDVTTVQGLPTTNVRVRDYRTGDVTFDSGAVTFIPQSFEAVDMDGDGLSDLALMGQSLAGEPNYLLFGFDGFMRLKDSCRFLPQSDPDRHAFGRITGGQALELVSIRYDQGIGRHRMQIHRPEVLDVWVNEELLSPFHSLRIEDADGNGLDEIYIKLSSSMVMYADSQAVTGVPVAAPARAPSGIALARPFPNPASGVTSISFTLSHSGPVALRVVDAAGRQVRSLAPGVLEAGPHTLEWDGRDDGGRRLAPGVYWAEVECAGARASRKIVQVR